MLNSLFLFVRSERFYLPIIYIICGILCYRIVVRTINSINKIDIKQGRGIDKRKNTIVDLINSITKYVIAIIVIILILGVYGVNTTSLLASLGVVTAIIGLAFQDTIKDFLAGVFLIFDNAYAVGDWVEIDGFSGEVVAFGLKTTKIRAYTGETMILSNSSFNKVLNHNLNHSKVYLKLQVHQDTNVEKLVSVLNEIKVLMLEDKDVYSMDSLGIDSFEYNCMRYAMIVECVSMTQFRLKRKLLGLIKEKFDAEGIVIPCNQVDVHIKK